MNREQMEAWCALEGLVLCRLDRTPLPNGYRLRRPGTKIDEPLITYATSEWTDGTSDHEGSYVAVPWEEMSDNVFAKLSPELLTELMKK